MDEPLVETHEEPDWPADADIREDFGHIVSLDVGQQQDYSALAVLQRWISSRYTTEDGTPVAVEQRELWRAAQRASEDARLDSRLGLTRHRVTSYGLVHIERLPLGTPFPRVVERVRRLMVHPTLQGRPPRPGQGRRPDPVLVYDATGGIGGMRDMFAQAGFPPGRRVWPVTIHGGNAVSFSQGFHRCPKRDLARLLAILLETPINRSRRLAFARRLPGLETLVGELKSFRVKINLATGHESFEAWRERDHDDEVLAVALGCWVGERLARDPVGPYTMVPIGAGIYASASKAPSARGA